MDEEERKVEKRDEKGADVDERLKKAELPAKLAAAYHPFYKGKIEIIPKCVIRNYDDFAIWYTPGVAKACRMIHENREEVYNLTNKWNNVAIVTDGTRVLGLGDIGPRAALPVMEGKSLLFKHLGGVDAFPICLDTKNPEEIIKIVKSISPSFGGVNLEDIEKPKCFYILDRLREELDIPVLHDDQQGTATVILAGLINALKVVGKKESDVTITLVGTGASNMNTAKFLFLSGADPGKIIMVDSKGILNRDRKELEEKAPEKWEMCLKTNDEQRSGGIEEALVGADVCIAASRPGPGVIRKEWVGKMSDDSIVFALANPTPEIWPWEAKEAGARIIATGRSDFPNQVNNSLGFPGIFRGVLEVHAKSITNEMCIEAAREIAKVAEERGVSEEFIIPQRDDPDVFMREAAVVGMKAIELGLARVKKTSQEIFDNAKVMIEMSQSKTAFLMKQDFIKQPPEI
jgi:malate dehydrogenase (oxaloacetate-decarboxylating)